MTDSICHITHNSRVEIEAQQLWCLDGRQSILEKEAFISSVELRLLCLDGRQSMLAQQFVVPLMGGRAFRVENLSYHFRLNLLLQLSWLRRNHSEALSSTQLEAEHFELKSVGALSVESTDSMWRYTHEAREEVEADIVCFDGTQNFSGISRITLKWCGRKMFPEVFVSIRDLYLYIQQGILQQMSFSIISCTWWREYFIEHRFSNTSWAFSVYIHIYLYMYI